MTPEQAARLYLDRQTGTKRPKASERQPCCGIMHPTVGVDKHRRGALHLAFLTGVARYELLRAVEERRGKDRAVRTAELIAQGKVLA